MGCCLSRPAATYNGASTSSQAIASSSRPQSRNAGPPRPSTNTSTNSATASSPPPRRRHHVPLNQHLNRPLRPHVWMSSNQMWTRRELDRERLEFFDTRVSGRAEIWQAINSALSVMWKGGDEGDEDGGVGTAQSILDAVGVTIPQGDLATGGCYDSLGEHYSLPEWVVSDPANILDEEDEGAGKADDEGEESEEIDEEALRRREAKGKAKVKEMVDVRARFQDGIHGDLIFSTGKDDAVKSLIRMITHKLEVRSITNPSTHPSIRPSIYLRAIYFE
ncbi:hypothetical protein ACMFMG_008768 [Clarireedia jacksonii]